MTIYDKLAKRVFSSYQNLKKELEKYFIEIDIMEKREDRLTIVLIGTLEQCRNFESGWQWHKVADQSNVFVDGKPVKEQLFQTPTYVKISQDKKPRFSI